ncbi:LysE family translocator [Peteryoungia desertarenae]|uniref:LysE family translocator n=1 Tax=Peteryoungia desertarenae TaxID=1813451 RepID=A0ABX6QRF9_9HYPH|nr:LysE family translocator [Peteryoungia desertarenae]QLF70861.1 LysE family translocator [Peteryoungia desertarenae]
MSHETWVAFAVVSAAFLAIPGPPMLLVVSYALGQGRKAALAAISGVALGNLMVFCAVLYLLAGLRWLSPGALTIIGWAGLFYLGLLLAATLRAPAGRTLIADNDNLAVERPMSILLEGVRTSIHSPRNWVGFVAILPYFMPASLLMSEPIGTMLTSLAALSLMIAFAYAMLAARIHGLLRKRKPRRVVSFRHDTVLIARRAVTAGYRKIAA